MMFRMLVLLALVLAACTSQTVPATLPPDTAVTSPPEDGMQTDAPPVNPFSPKPGDENLTRGSVFINEASLVIRESYPPQISLSIKGDLPTPCHELRAAIAEPDHDNKIMVDAYSVADSTKVCTQVLEPFEEYIDLGMFPSGHYSVWVNGELAGEFDA